MGQRLGRAVVNGLPQDHKRLSGHPASVLSTLSVFATTSPVVVVSLALSCFVACIHIRRCCPTLFCVFELCSICCTEIHPPRATWNPSLDSTCCHPLYHHMQNRALIDILLVNRHATVTFADSPMRYWLSLWLNEYGACVCKGSEPKSKPYPPFQPPCVSAGACESPWRTSALSISSRFTWTPAAPGAICSVPERNDDGRDVMVWAGAGCVSGSASSSTASRPACRAVRPFF